MKSVTSSVLYLPLGSYPYSLLSNTADETAVNTTQQGSSAVETCKPDSPVPGLPMTPDCGKEVWESTEGRVTWPHSFPLGPCGSTLSNPGGRRRSLQGWAPPTPGKSANSLPPPSLGRNPPVIVGSVPGLRRHRLTSSPEKKPFICFFTAGLRSLDFASLSYAVGSSAQVLATFTILTRESKTM